ncbi:MAG: diguanylate cyclase [Candidatus Aminicenantes bacterium]|nr:MAG: diguanylate cyclase [Candidatus Aminicenantes bacterium]
MKVLIAEDNSVSAKILQKNIRDWGYEVILTKDGREAWLALQSNEINLAILDWMMPEINGIQLCQKIRNKDHQKKDQEYTYVILLTAKDEQKDLIKGFSAGADDYITKPFHHLELKARLKTGKRIVDLQNQLQEQASRDHLTGLWNRKRMFRILDKEINRAQRDNHPLAIVMIDIDKFKTINDTHGHHVGDLVLQEAARLLKKNVRNYDEICRYGGDELLVILPNCNLTEVETIAERFREMVHMYRISDNSVSLNITFSLGGTSIENHTKDVTAEALILAADEALLEAKNKGRNCVVINKKIG